MNFDSENIVPNGPTSIRCHQSNGMRLSTNKSLQKPIHHSNKTPLKPSTNNAPRPKRRALGDITNKRNSSSASSSALHKTASKPLSIRTAQPPSANNNETSSSKYLKRIPKDEHGDVLSPETIPRPSGPPVFEEPVLLDSDDEYVSAGIRERRNAIFTGVKLFTSPIRQQKPLPNSFIFDDFQESPQTTSPPTSNVDNLFNSASDSPKLELNFG